MTEKDAMNKLMDLLKKHKFIVCIIIGIFILSTILNLFIPIINKDIMDNGFIGGNFSLFIRDIIVSFSLYVFITLLRVLSEKFRVNLSTQLQYNLNKEAFNHLMHVQISFYDNKNYAETFRNICMDIANISAIADEGMFFAIMQLFCVVGGIVGLVLLDYKMTIIILCFIPIKCIIINYFAEMHKRIMDYFISADEEYASWFGNTVGGIKEIRLFGLMKIEQRDFSKKMKKLLSEQKRLSMLSQWNISVDSIMIQLLILIVYIVGGSRVFQHQLTIGTVFAFITYSVYVTGPISTILNVKYELTGIIPSTKRFYDFLSIPEEKSSNIKNIPDWNEISFYNICFFYTQGFPIINNVNFKIRKGDKIAFVGENGSGKSTIIELLLRFRNPQRGEICIGDTNIDDICLEKYRELFSVVSQHDYLFNDTIRNNICLYKDIDDEIINKACIDSGLIDFINEVSLDYVVGVDGVMLSGGQKKKVALARALILDRPIFILDEVTSNADASSEIHINSLLRTRLKDKTVIVVSHREAILRDIDNIIVMDSGRIKHVNTYSDILRIDNTKKVGNVIMNE